MTAVLCRSTPVQADAGAGTDPTVGIHDRDVRSAAPDRLDSTGGDPSSSTPWRTAAEAAIYVRCSVRQLKNHVARGEVSVYRRGRVLRFHVDDLDAFLRAGATDAA